MYLPMQQSKVIRKKIILYGGNFNTTSLYNQKVDVHHVNRSKAEELGARRLQRPKIFQLGKKIFLVLSMNQAILIHLPKFCFLAFFGLVAFIKAKRPKFFTVCQITFYFPSNNQNIIITVLNFSLEKRWGFKNRQIFRKRAFLNEFRDFL